MIGDEFSDNLYWFIKGRGATDAVIKRYQTHLKLTFDKANGKIIMYELSRMGVPGQLLQWIGDYLHGQRAQLAYQGALLRTSIW